jgi:hypothetical protein
MAVAGTPAQQNASGAELTKVRISYPTGFAETVGRTSPGMGEGRAMQEQLPRGAAVERTGMYLQGELRSKTR